MITEKTMKRLQTVVDGWKKRYEKYDEELVKFYSTPKIVRWWKGLKEPGYPKFQSTVVYEDYNCEHDTYVVIELRCYNRKLFAAIGVDNKEKKTRIGFKENLATGKREPLLGSTGMNVGNDADFIDAVIDDLKTLSWI